jgi:drug/metabolite transporter (DMT)-like permease
VTRAVITLLMGALAIGLAPIFVKLLMTTNTVGPVSAGFWRMFIGALGFALMMLLSRDRGQSAKSIKRLFVDARFPAIMAGVLFALDLAAWHTSFAYTSVTASTLIANLSSILVPLAGVIFFKESFNRKIVFGGLLAVIGVAWLTMSRPAGSGGAEQHSYVLGEGLAFLTAFFYTGYMLCVKSLSKRFSSRSLMFLSSAISSVLLLIFALVMGQELIPERNEGWLWILSLGLISQVAGQGLIAKALAVLPVSRSALILLSAPVATAVFGWIFLGEALSMSQMLSVILTLLGIGIVANR